MFAAILKAVRKGRLARMLVYVFCFMFVLLGCASTTIIKSKPEGAAVFIDNIRMGSTPLQYSDTAIAGTTKALKLTKQGYRPLETVIRKSEVQWGPLIGGIFILFPFIWILGYPENYEFELEKAGDLTEKSI